MRPLTVAADAVPRELLTEEFVSAVVLGLVRKFVPGAESDASLATSATAREDHFRVSVYTERYEVYAGLESLGATITTKLYERGIPTLIYPEIVRPEPSRARGQAEFLKDQGVVRIVIPFEPTFVRQPDGSIERESLTTARARILKTVKEIASSARLAPKEAGPPKNEAHLHLDLAEYEALAARLPDHLLDGL